MARSKRTFKRKRKVRADWVYRPQVQGQSARGAYSGLGTNLIPNNVGAGLFNQQAFILLDSTAFLRVLTTESFQTTADLPAAARPEWKRLPTVHMVEGDIPFRLSQFLTGNQVLWGWRLGWFEQDTIDGRLSLQAEWSMFEPQIQGTTLQDDLATFANESKQNLRERHFFRRNETEDLKTAGVFQFRERLNSRAPTEKHALAILFEMSGTYSSSGVTMELWPFVRSLIS